jgi:3-hydroxypropionate dehydrogenase (NADP+)
VLFARVEFSKQVEEHMDIKKISCIGAGLIGHSWATFFSWKGYEVTLQDLRKETLEQALSQIRQDLKFLSEKGILKDKTVEDCLGRIRITSNLEEAVADADYVQESVYESYQAKKRVFKSMDAITPSETIIASSSSTLKMTLVQKATKNPARCIIAHPWNPPHLMPLVEIIPGKKTSTETVKAAKEFMTKLGKVAVVQKKEMSGTIGNRLAAALWREAIDLVYKDVAELEDIDKAVSAGPGIRWAILGPHLSYHLGGGKGGIEYYLHHLGPAMAARWRTLATWTSIPSKAERKIINEIRKMKLLQEKHPDEIARWRDEKLIELLKVLYGDSGLQG